MKEAKTIKLLEELIKVIDAFMNENINIDYVFKAEDELYNHDFDVYMCTVKPSRTYYDMKLSCLYMIEILKRSLNNG